MINIDVLRCANYGHFSNKLKEIEAIFEAGAAKDRIV